MTNSTPKLNNKMERQVSPSTGGKRSNQRNSRRNYQRNSQRNYQRNNQWNSQLNSQLNNQLNSQLNSQRSELIKTTTFYSSGARSQGSSGRMSCSPPFSSDSARSSPIKNESPRISPTNSFYAGAKFSEPPSPASLPKPPSHWMNLVDTCRQAESVNINDHLQVLVEVEA